MRHSYLAYLAALAAVISAPAATAAPIEYVRVCYLYGANYFYSPGTDMCVNAVTGATKSFLRDAKGNVVLDSNGDPIVADGLTASQQGIVDAQSAADLALEGVAMSLAMQPAIVTPGNTYAVSANVGTFAGKLALGLSGAIAINENVTVNAAIGGGMSGTFAGRGGVNISW